MFEFDVRRVNFSYYSFRLNFEFVLRTLLFSSSFVSHSNNESLLLFLIALKTFEPFSCNSWFYSDFNN